MSRSASVPLLFLSAHLDDAVLSCGATIRRLADEGHRVPVITVFTGQPDAPRLPLLGRAFHEACNLGPDAMGTRRDEDREACAVLGAAPVHLPFYECLYRAGDDGGPVYREEESIYGMTAAADDGLAQEVGAALRALTWWTSAERVAVPLGVGRHVDHQLVRLAAEWAALGSPAKPLLYYEDQPYASWGRDGGWEEDLIGQLVAETRGAHRPHWEAKIEAITCYRSQVEMLWPGDGDWARSLEVYAGSLVEGALAERFWGPGR